MSRPRRFAKVYVEITSACNLACSFCPPTSRPGAFLSVDAFDRIVEEVAPLTDHLFLHVKGEPLLHPQLEALLDRAQAADLRVNLVTNGTLVAASKDLLRHAALHQVSVSLHSFQGGEPEALEYLEPIFALSRLASSSHGPRIALRLWRQPNPALLSVLQATFGPLPLEGRRGTEVLPGVYVHRDQEFVWPRLADPVVSAAGFCRGLRDQVAILVDGTVVPCCLDGDGHLSLGNVFTTPLADILAGPRAQDLYRGFTEGRRVEALCQRCSFADVRTRA